MEYVIIVGVVTYFIPAIVSFQRDTKHKTGITILNVFLGWTGLGWIGALVWAVSDPQI